MNLSLLIYWLPMILIAFANAALRQGVLIRFFDAHRAHQWSTITLMIFSFLYTLAIFHRLEITAVGKAWLTGVVWVILTLLFEFGLGLLMGKSLNELTEQYHIERGHLWILFLAWLLLLPWLVYTIKRSV